MTQSDDDPLDGDKNEQEGDSVSETESAPEPMFESPSSPASPAETIDDDFDEEDFDDDFDDDFDYEEDNTAFMKEDDEDDDDDFDS